MTRSKEMVQEKRILPQELSEVRALQNDEGVWHIPGKGIVFNQRSRRLGYFVEIIDQRALDSANIENVISCYNHDMNYILGNIRNQTLTLEITEGSLNYDIVPPDNQSIRDLVLAPIQRRDVTGSSFMFDVAKDGDEWEKEGDDLFVRYVRKIDVLYELGPVSMPAYLGSSTDAAKRSFDSFIKHTHEVETNYKRQFAQNQLMLLKK